jgi:hypothetical protein
MGRAIVLRLDCCSTQSQFQLVGPLAGPTVRLLALLSVRTPSQQCQHSFELF